VLVQRVLSAAVRVDGRVVGALERPGLLALVGVTHDDGPAQADWAGERVAGLRVLRSEGEREGGREVSAVDAGAPVLVVSQFTLYADTRRGRRPTWAAAAPGHQAEPLVDRVVQRLRGHGLQVATGVFGAHMVVESAGDGPVTIWLDSDDAGRASP
jgi:D-tyrosyl-tRNA(Tyr) deacylase